MKWPLHSKFAKLMPQKAAQVRRGTLAAQDSSLLSYLNALEMEDMDGYIAVKLNLSELNGTNITSADIDNATQAFRTYLAHCGGEVFILSNDDVVFINDGDMHDDVFDAVEKITSFFRDDPFVRHHGRSSLAKWYDLGQDAHKLNAFASGRVNSDGGFIADQVDHSLDSDFFNNDQEKDFLSELKTFKTSDRKPLTPELFLKLYNALSVTDLSPYLKRQPVCAMTPNFRPQPVFYHIGFDINEVKEAIAPNIQLEPGNLLFRELSKTFDGRLLNTFKRSKSLIPKLSFSFHLSIESILTIDLENLIAMIKGINPWHIIIEIDILEAFEDLRRYFQACERLRENGLRISLRGIRFSMLPMIKREYLQANFLKLEATRALKSLSEDAIDQLVKFIDQAGENRVILGNCDDKKSTRIGYQLGITLFQGNYIDYLVGE